MRGFSHWVAAKAAALSRWASQDQEQSRRDGELLAYLKEERARKAAGSQGPETAQRGRFEGLLERLGPLPAGSQDEPLSWGRVFWEPLSRLYPQGECWGWLRQWGAERGLSPDRLGASPAALFERAARLDAGGSRQGARLGAGALDLGLSASGAGAFEERELSPLGLALRRGALGLAERLREEGAGWEGCGLGAGELALRCKDALWPEPIEALAREGARLDRHEAAPALDFSSALARMGANQGAPEAQERALRCAKALLAMGADPNQAPAKGEGRRSRFPLEGALAARAEGLCEWLLSAGADPEDARVKGRLERALGEGNPAADAIERSLRGRKAERDERYALWGMYQRGELFAADGSPLRLSDRLRSRREGASGAAEAVPSARREGGV